MAHREFDFKSVRVTAACAVVDRVKVGERAKERLLLRADQRGGEEGAQHCDAVKCPNGEMDLHCRQREFLELQGPVVWAFGCLTCCGWLSCSRSERTTFCESRGVLFEDGNFCEKHWSSFSKRELCVEILPNCFKTRRKKEPTPLTLRWHFLTVWLERFVRWLSKLPQDRLGVRKSLLLAGV